MKTCSVEDCLKPHDSHGYCGMHAKRYRRYGSPEIRKRIIGGHRSWPEYTSWTNMRQRCNNPNHPEYHYWGGKGVKVDPAWDKSFHAFYEAVGPKPSPSHSIDRIDGSGNYEPGNVRWASTTEQHANRTLQTGATGVYGVTFNKRDKRYVVRIFRDGKRHYLGRFLTLELAQAAISRFYET